MKDRFTIKGKYEDVIFYDDDKVIGVSDVVETLNNQSKRIEELEHQLHTCHGLYASDKEDMSEPFRLDFSKTLKD